MGRPGPLVLIRECETMAIKYLTPLLLACALSGCAHKATTTSQPQAAAGPSGDVIKYGIFRLVRRGHLQNDVSTATGKIIANPVLQLVEQTDRVPLEKDTYFAYQYRISQIPHNERKAPWLELRRVLIHPEIVTPTGMRVSRSERTIRGRIEAGQIIALDGYVFSEDYEMVEGEWIFQIWHDERLLVQQTFTAWRTDKAKSKAPS